MSGILTGPMANLQTQLANRAPYDPSKGGVPTRGMSSDINTFNGYMRQQPWYQQWFTQQGLNPNQVHLNDGQRHQLEAVLAQHGYNLHGTDGMNIDPAGNLNNPHGFASQPTWLKAIEIGAPIAATAGFGAAGMGPLGGVLGGTSGAAGEVGTLAGAGLPAAELTPSLASYGFGAGATAAGVTGASGATTAALGGTPTLSAAPNLTAGMSTMPAAGATTVGGAGSTIGSMLGKVPGSTQNYADAGKLLESFGNDEQYNRLTRGTQSQGYDKLMLDAAQNRRTDESDAMKKLAQTAYIGQGGSHFQLPQSLSIGGREANVPQLGLGPTPVSSAQQQGASTLEQTMLDRLKNGSYTPTPLSSYSQPGAAEKIGQYGSLATAGLGLAKNIFGF